MLSPHEMSPAPNWLCDLILSKPQRNTVPSVSTGILTGAPFSEGRRNSDFASLAGALRRKGLNAEQIKISLSATNETLPNPLPESEIHSIAYGMMRYPITSIENITHKTLAETMLKELKDKVLYCVGKSFYVYNDGVWTEDIGDLIILNEAIKITDGMMAQVQTMIADANNDEDREKYNGLRKSVLKAQATPFLKNAIEQFRSLTKIRTTFSELNSQKHLINMKDSVFNLKTMKSEPHSPSHRFTWKLNFNYEEKAECPTFDGFLDTALSAPIQRMLLQLIACSLTGNDREQVFVYLHGVTNSGKSTIIKTLYQMFQPISSNVEPSTFMVKFGESIPNDIARLAGKRFVFTSETKLGSIADGALLKRLSAKDPITARFMRQEFFEYVPEFLIFIATNYLPVISGEDSALKRRILIVPFERTVPDNEVDGDLPRKFLREQEGIFNRIINALKDYEVNGLCIPPEVRDKVNQYVDSSNMLLRFYIETLEICDDEKGMSARRLYSLYSDWSNAHGLKPMSEPQFKILFEKTSGINQEYNARGNYWPRVRMRMQ
jgi:putative DNA primase/helicase